MLAPRYSNSQTLSKLYWAIVTFCPTRPSLYACSICYHTFVLPSVILNPTCLAERSSLINLYIVEIPTMSRSSANACRIRDPWYQKRSVSPPAFRTMLFKVMLNSYGEHMSPWLSTLIISKKAGVLFPTLTKFDPSIQVFVRLINFIGIPSYAIEFQISTRIIVS